MVALEGGDAADDEGGFGDTVLAAVCGFLFRGGWREVGGIDEAWYEEMARNSRTAKQPNSRTTKGRRFLVQHRISNGGVVVGLGGMLEIGESGESGGGFIGYVAEEEHQGTRNAECGMRMGDCSLQASGNDIILGMNDIRHRCSILPTQPAQEGVGE